MLKGLANPAGAALCSMPVVGGAGFLRDLWVEWVRCEGRGSENKEEQRIKKSQPLGFSDCMDLERDQRQGRERGFHLGCILHLRSVLYNRPSPHLVV